MLANRKSDHAHRNANSETVTTAFRLTGTTIDRKVRIAPAPSMRAACSSSLGIRDMNAVKISTPNGTAMVESAMMSPHTVLSRPSLM